MRHLQRSYHIPTRMNHLTHINILLNFAYFQVFLSYTIQLLSWVPVFRVLIFNGFIAMNHIPHVEEKCYVCISCLLTNSKDSFLLIIEKYPAIKKLMGYDWRIAVQVFITVLIQLIMAILVRDLPWKFVWLLTYIISGTLNHSLSISFHESMK